MSKILVTRFTLTHPVSNITAANRYLSAEDMSTYLGPLFPSVLHILWHLHEGAAGTVTVRAQESITQEELDGLREWISDQHSDGLGETFAQQDFAVHGDVHSDFNWESDDYTLRPLASSEPPSQLVSRAIGAEGWNRFPAEKTAELIHELRTEVQRLQREAGAEALEDAAAQIEQHAQRTDNRFTEHVVAEVGGAMLLREYAETLRAESQR